MSRTSTEWRENPRLPATHYVDSRIYTEEEIHREEIEKIFNKVWLIACHESELPNDKHFNFRHSYIFAHTHWRLLCDAQSTMVGKGQRLSDDSS